MEPELSDLREHTLYNEPFTETHATIRLFWEVVGTFSADDLRKLIHFVTGTEKVDPRSACYFVRKYKLIFVRFLSEDLHT